MSSTRQRQFSANSGFSLLELLVVITVVTLLSTLALPAISGIFQASGFSSNVTNIQYLVKEAKAKAMAQNTFVWLGFSPTTNNGSPCLIAVIVAGKSGLSTDLANNNYTLATKPLMLRNVQMVDSTTFNLSGFDITNATDLLQYKTDSTFSQPVAGQTTVFTSVLVFNPNGEVTLDTTKAFRRITIGLKAGSQASIKTQVAAIQVTGLSAEPTIFRQ